jgi:hypothetical protein
LINVYGDWIIIARLMEWVGRGVLEYERRDGAGWGQHAFRITNVGRRLRDERMQSVAEAPAIYTGVVGRTILRGRSSASSKAGDGASRYVPDSQVL